MVVLRPPRGRYSRRAGRPAWSRGGGRGAGPRGHCLGTKSTLQSRSKLTGVGVESALPQRSGGGGSGWPASSQDASRPSNQTVTVPISPTTTSTGTSSCSLSCLWTPTSFLRPVPFAAPRPWYRRGLSDGGIVPAADDPSVGGSPNSIREQLRQFQFAGVFDGNSETGTESSMGRKVAVMMVARIQAGRLMLRGRIGVPRRPGPFARGAQSKVKDLEQVRDNHELDRKRVELVVSLSRSGPIRSQRWIVPSGGGAAARLFCDASSALGVKRRGYAGRHRG